jgi:hypothetical protein
MMRYHRRKWGYPSSEKGKPMTVTVRQEDEPFELELDPEHPPDIFMLPKVPPPRALFGPWPSPNSVTAWGYASLSDFPKDTVVGVPFRADTYGRMMAKIAHAFAVAEVGLDGFAPVLQPTILSEQEDPFQFVGCQEQADLPKQSWLHEMSFLCWEQKGACYLVVKVRLLAHLGAPEYYVVVGTVKELPVAAMRRLFRSAARFMEGKGSKPPVRIRSQLVTT